ncbi:hypothetical protein [Streptomyces sp. NPDC004267]|uniref:hypothetical protein n=1 Tax=Streptomyces sp. NPDC004267 TaxID=3364694 RepID=UPI0036C25161
MTTTHTGHAEAALPTSLTPARIAHLATLVAAGARAQRVATTSPYTGAPLADLPVSTPAACRWTSGRWWSAVAAPSETRSWPAATT